MEIRSLQLGPSPTWGDRVSALVGGREVWFDIVGSPAPLRRSYDPFLLAGFVLAMDRAENVSIAQDAPTSTRLVENLGAAMTLYSAWWPEVGAVPVECSPIDRVEAGASGLVGCFFSGGVDSLYSVLANQDEISHLILCRGLDIPSSETARWERTVEGVQSMADALRKGLILIDTNAKHALKARVDNHGAILVSTALALGFERLIVPASHSLAYTGPWGSHPMLDPLFGNGVTEVVHDSPLPRFLKIEGIVRSGIGLDSLRVCNVTSRYNCGKCEKCLRTSLALALMGASSDALAPLRDPRKLRSVRIYSDSQYDAWSGNRMYASSLGRDDIVTEVDRILRNYRVRNSLRSLDRDLLNGVVGKLRSKLRRLNARR